VTGDKLARIEALVDDCVQRGITRTTDYRTADVLALVNIAKAALRVWVNGHAAWCSRQDAPCDCGYAELSQSLAALGEETAG
jgi:hypothetical protein